MNPHLVEYKNAISTIKSLPADAQGRLVAYFEDLEDTLYTLLREDATLSTELILKEHLLMRDLKLSAFPSTLSTETRKYRAAIIEEYLSEAEELLATTSLANAAAIRELIQFRSHTELPFVRDTNETLSSYVQQFPLCLSASERAHDDTGRSLNWFTAKIRSYCLRTDVQLALELYSDENGLILFDEQNYSEMARSLSTDDLLYVVQAPCITNEQQEQLFFHALRQNRKDAVVYLDPILNVDIQFIWYNAILDKETECFETCKALYAQREIPLPESVIQAIYERAPSAQAQARMLRSLQSEPEHHQLQQQLFDSSSERQKLHFLAHLHHDTITPDEIGTLLQEMLRTNMLSTAVPPFSEYIQAHQQSFTESDWKSFEMLLRLAPSDLQDIICLMSPKARYSEIPPSTLFSERRECLNTLQVPDEEHQELLQKYTENPYSTEEPPSVLRQYIFDMYLNRPHRSLTFIPEYMSQKQWTIAEAADVDSAWVDHVVRNAPQENVVQTLSDIEQVVRSESCKRTFALGLEQLPFQTLVDLCEKKDATNVVSRRV